MGFLKHPYVDFLGASPDGLIIEPENEKSQLIEIKCPMTRNIQTKAMDISGIIPAYYYEQI